MLQSDPDPVFADEVDTYISDESDSALPTTQLDHRTPPQTPPPLTTTPPPSTSSHDSIRLHRQRLNRLHEDAKSFLSNVEASASALLKSQPPSQSTDDRHIQLDQIRLARFHRQAVSFLDRVYSDDCKTLITEEALSPAGLAAAHSPTPDRESLERFHHEAMNFLDVAASATSLSPTASHPPPNRVPNLTPPHPHPADDTSLRIERDKARLEQHYQDAISFLNRADNACGLVEEQELETAAVDRMQLQKYAREAMSFLNKAFRGDSSIMVDDGDDTNRSLILYHNPLPLVPAQTDHTQSQQPDSAYAAQLAARADPLAFGVIQNAHDHFSIRNDPLPLEKPHDSHSPINPFLSNQIGLSLHAANSPRTLDRSPHSTPRSAPPPRRHLHSDEDRQIAVDRAALERYDEEFGDFLSKAYLDDCTVIVDDADSEASGLEGSALALPKSIEASEHSNYSAYQAASEREDNGSDDAFTDEEFQEPEVRHGARPRRLSAGPIPNRPPVVDIGAGTAVDPNQTLRHRMEVFEREAAGYLEDVNVSEEEETDIEQSDQSRPLSNVDYPKLDDNPFISNNSAERNKQILSPFPRKILNNDEHGMDEKPNSSKSDNDGPLDKADAKDLSIVSLGSDPKVREESHLFNTTDEVLLKPSEIMKWGNRSTDNRIIDDGHEKVSRRQTPQHNFRSTDRFSDKNRQNGDMTMDLRLEDKSGRSEDWCGVEMKTSFYRQIPRGSTIKLRPRALDDEAGWRGLVQEEVPRTADGRVISASVLQRVEKERDVLMATLEELVNERSMLAAQVSEMKSIFPGAHWGRHGQTSSGGTSNSSSSRLEDIDLTAELREAHAIMAKLTEEMEETLSILDKRYQETLDRAHKAEERCIRLESNSYRLHAEFTAQGRRLALALAEEQKLRALIDNSESEFMELRSKSEQDMVRIEEQYRVECERATGRIRELTAEVGSLQEQVKSGNQKAVKSRGVNQSTTRHLETEMASLKGKLGESERALEKERKEAKRKETEGEKRRSLKVEEEIGKVQQQAQQQRELEVQEVQARGSSEAEKFGKELRKLKSENSRLLAEMNETGQRRDDLESAVKQARRRQTGAEAETKQMRALFEESVKERISKLDQTAEFRQLQKSISALKEGASVRENLLESQLEEFRTRAEQAEVAAAAAAHGAKEAAEMAKLAQERSRSAVEVERASRQAAESEREAAVSEFEELKLKQRDSNKSETPVVKSGSRRGLRKSSSRTAKEAEKLQKKKEARAGGSEDGGQGRKRVPHRPRLFG